MKKIVLGMALLSSVTSFATCIEHHAFSNNEGMYEWCTGDKVYVEKEFNSSKYLSGVITKVSKVNGHDWFSTSMGIKITVRLSNNKTVTVGSHDSFKAEGCQIYSRPWGSKDRCVGDNVEMAIYAGNTNLSSGKFETGKIFAIGFRQALVQKADGSIIMRGEFE